MHGPIHPQGRVIAADAVIVRDVIDAAVLGHVFPVEATADAPDPRPGYPVPLSQWHAFVLW
jgi:hypothetical protein